MFIDARTIPDGTVVDTDVVIVGAGAAGITLGRTLAGSQRQVLLLESGGLDFDADTQDLYVGETLNPLFAPLDATRLRFFGGSTNHWEGYCRPFDPIDFEARDGIPLTGWPFGRDALEPYYRAAQKICELGPFNYDPATWADGPRRPFALDGGLIGTGLYQNGPPTRFGPAYGPELAAAPGVTIHLHANVTDLGTPATPTRVDRLAVQTLAGTAYTVRPRTVVLAAGGIENARLLLNADRVATAGLGNGHGMVGRTFMDHPALFKSGTVLFAEDYPELSFYRFRKNDPVAPNRGFFTAPAATLRREGLLNFAIGLIPASARDVSEGAASLGALVRAFGRGGLPDDLGRHLGNVIGDLDGLAAAAYRKAVAGFDRRLFATFFVTDVAPQMDSRVTLSAERDAIGQRRVTLDWRLSADFERQFDRAHALLAEALGAAGLGRVRTHERGSALDPMVSYRNSHHHMGTTRMCDDPRTGVVDASCRVHGMANLYVAGSSVFPTYGHATPTLTIVALALRLADHLKSVS